MRNKLNCISFCHIENENEQIPLATHYLLVRTKFSSGFCENCKDKFLSRYPTRKFVTKEKYEKFVAMV